MASLRVGFCERREKTVPQCGILLPKVLKAEICFVSLQPAYLILVGFAISNSITGVSVKKMCLGDKYVAIYFSSVLDGPLLPSVGAILSFYSL